MPSASKRDLKVPLRRVAVVASNYNQIMESCSWNHVDGLRVITCVNVEPEKPENYNSRSLFEVGLRVVRWFRGQE